MGSALASKMKGEDRISVAYFGDGAASAGDCHESMNFAAIHKLPVIFFCENNKYAISVPLSKQMATDNISSRAQGYGIPGVSVDGCDITAVFEATTQAAIRARAGEGPTFIEADVERYLPHTSDDDDSIYRSPEEIEQAKQDIDIRTFRQEFEGTFENYAGSVYYNFHPVENVVEKNKLDFSISINETEKIFVERINILGINKS